MLPLASPAHAPPCSTSMQTCETAPSYGSSPQATLACLLPGDFSHPSQSLLCKVTVTAAQGHSQGHSHCCASPTTAAHRQSAPAAHCHSLQVLARAARLPKWPPHYASTHAHAPWNTKPMVSSDSTTPRRLTTHRAGAPLHAQPDLLMSDFHPTAHHADTHTYTHMGAPWHTQSKVLSDGFHSTAHPRWGQTPLLLCSRPSASRYRATLDRPAWTTMPWPAEGGRGEEGGQTRWRPWGRRSNMVEAMGDGRQA